MAANAELAIRITAQDRASKALQQMSGHLGGLQGRLGAVGSGISKVFGTLRSAALPAVGVVVAAGFAIKSFVSEAAKAQEVQASLNATLKSTKGVAGVTADAINKHADALSRLTKFDDEAIVGAQSLLLTFTRIGKDVFPKATEAILDLSEKMGQDLQTSTIQIGKALNDPIKGLTSLTRIGVTFTEQQKDQIKTMVEAGDIMGAQGIILKELQTEFGGAARAAGDTFAGKMVILGNQIDNVKEIIGNAFIPILTAAATALANFLAGHQAEIEEFARLFSQKVVNALRDVGIVLARDVLPLVIRFGQWVSDNGETIRGTFISFAEGAKLTGDAIATMGNWIMDNQAAIVAAIVAIGLAFAFTNPGGAVLVGLGALITLLGLFKASADDLSAPMLEMRILFRSIGLSIVGTIINIIEAMDAIPGVELGNTVFELRSKLHEWREEMINDEYALATLTDAQKIAAEATKPLNEQLRNSRQRLQDAGIDADAYNLKLRDMIHNLGPGVFSARNVSEQLAIIQENLHLGKREAQLLLDHFNNVNNANLGAVKRSVDDLASKLGIAKDKAADLFTAITTGFATGGGIRGIQIAAEARQHGGPVTAGRPYVVGERGPELFIPKSAGRIVAAASDIERALGQVQNPTAVGPRGSQLSPLGAFQRLIQQGLTAQQATARLFSRGADFAGLLPDFMRELAGQQRQPAAQPAAQPAMAPGWGTPTVYNFTFNAPVYDREGLKTEVRKTIRELERRR